MFIGVIEDEIKFKWKTVYNGRVAFFNWDIFSNFTFFIGTFFDSTYSWAFLRTPLKGSYFCLVSMDSMLS